jgi:hypothetical protein
MQYIFKTKLKWITEPSVKMHAPTYHDVKVDSHDTQKRVCGIGLINHSALQEEPSTQMDGQTDMRTDGRTDRE